MPMVPPGTQIVPCLKGGFRVQGLIIVLAPTVARETGLVFRLWVSGFWDVRAFWGFRALGLRLECFGTFEF